MSMLEVARVPIEVTSASAPTITTQLTGPPRLMGVPGRTHYQHADTPPISKAGAWEAFEGIDASGEPACALALNRVNPAGGAIVVKSWRERTYCACAPGATPLPRRRR